MPADCSKLRVGIKVKCRTGSLLTGIDGCGGRIDQHGLTRCAVTRIRVTTMIPESNQPKSTYCGKEIQVSRLLDLGEGGEEAGVACIVCYSVEPCQLLFCTGTSSG